MNIKAVYAGVMLTVIAGVVLPAGAQNTTAPYSVYGIGDIEQRAYTNTSGMGYTGIGIKSTQYTIGSNPASVAGLPTSMLLLEAAGAGRSLRYTGTPITTGNATAQDFSLKKIGLSVKLNKFWGSSVGLQQHSYVGYQFKGQKAVEGAASTYTLQYSGDGGLYDFYWNHGFALGKHFSVGLTGSFVAGPVNQTEQLVDESGNLFEQKRRDYYGNFRLNTGLLYSGKLSKNWTLTAGATYGPRSAANFERSYTLTQNSADLTADTLFSYHRFSLPQSAAVGFSLVGSKGVTWAADHSIHYWTPLNIHGSGWQLTNSQRSSMGVEFAQEDNQRGKVLLRKAFQLGAFHQTSYQQVSGKQISGYGFTAGISRMLKNGFMYTTTLEAGTRGTVQRNLIRENYLQLSVHLSYRDLLLSKGRRFD